MSEHPDLEQRPRVVTFDGVIALLLGLITLGFGVVLLLAPVRQGFLFAPIGVVAAGFGLRGMRDRRFRASLVLPAIGMIAGLLGAVLVVVGLIRAWLGV
jgi:hypothetical protein